MNKWWINIPRPSSVALVVNHNTPEIPTTSYEVIDIPNPNELPPDIQDFFWKNTWILQKLLAWELKLWEWKQQQALVVNTVYPQDAIWKDNHDKLPNWIIRCEEMMSFVTVNPETSEILYLWRTRPTDWGINTPGQSDPWVFSHWWMAQAWVINAWRYVADKFWVSDKDLTPEQYKQYLGSYSLPENISIIDLWHILLWNWSNARNKNKEISQFEPRTSWLMFARALVVSYTDFLTIYEEQKNNTIKYAIESISDTEIQDITPKHRKFRELLQQCEWRIQTVFTELQNEVKKRVNQSL